MRLRPVVRSPLRPLLRLPLDGRLSAGGGTPALAVTGFLAAGDSITYGVGTTLDPYPAQITNITGYANLNVGVGGELASNFDTNYASRIGAFYNASTCNTLIFLGGTNDLDFGAGGSVGVSAATLQATLLSIVTKAKATGFKVVVGTITPRSLGTGQNWDASKEANRVTVNAWIRSTLSATADRVMDFAAIAAMANPAGANYQDGLHPNDTGNAYLAECARSAMGLPLVAAATAVSMTGPTSGFTSGASFNFTVSGNGGVMSAGVSTTIVVTPSDGGGGGTFTPSTVTIRAGDPTPKFSYRPASNGAKTISVTNGGGLTNPSNITYTASAGTATVGSFGTLTRSIAETGVVTTGPFTYVSTHNSFINYANVGALSNLKRQVSTDGFLTITKQTNGDFMYGVTTATTVQAYGALPYAIQCYEGNVYRPFSLGSLGTPTNTVTPAAADQIRMRFTSTDLVAEVSKNSGGSWTTIFTWSGFTNSAYAFEVCVGTSGTIVAGAASGLA